MIGRADHILDLKSWYSGKCLIEHLDALRLPQRGVNKPLRVSIFDYYKSDMGNVIGDCVQAKVESGIIKQKDELVLLPLNCLVTIKSIEMHKQKV